MWCGRLFREVVYGVPREVEWYECVVWKVYGGGVRYVQTDGMCISSESIHLSSLTDLNLTHNDIMVYGARALANSEFLGRLMHVDLSSNKIDEVGLQALLQSKLLNGYNDLKMDIKHRRTSDDDSG